MHLLGCPLREKIIAAAIVLVFFFYFIPFIWHAFETIFAPYDIDAMEGVVLNGAVNLFNGKTIYPRLDSYPYVPVIYPPLFHSVAAFVLIPVFGETFASTRMLSFLSSLLAVFFVYKIIFYMTTKRLLSILVSLLLLTSHYTYWWGPLGRIDWLAVAFSIIGLYLVIKYEDSPKVFSSIPFFVLAFFTKQSFFVAPVAVAVYLFLKGEKSHSLNFSLGVSLISAVVFLVFQLLTKGMFFVQVFKVMGGISSSVAVSWARWQRFLFSYPVPFCFGAFAAITALRGASKKKSILFSFCFLFSAVTAVYSVGRPGAAENYFVEVIIFSYILLGLLFSQILDKKPLLFEISRIVLLLIVIVGHGVHFRPVYVLSWSPLKLQLGYSPPGQEIKKSVDEIIRNTEGKILVDAELGYLIRNNKQVLIDPLNMHGMEKQGLWKFPGSELAKDLENKNISLVVVAQKFLSPAIMEQIYKNYDLLTIIAPYYFYKPRPLSLPP